MEQLCNIIVFSHSPCLFQNSSDANAAEGPLLAAACCKHFAIYNVSNAVLICSHKSSFLFVVLTVPCILALSSWQVENIPTVRFVFNAVRAHRVDTL